MDLTTDAVHGEGKPRSYTNIFDFLKQACSAKSCKQINTTIEFH